MPRGECKCQEPMAAVLPEILMASGEPCPKGKPAGRLSDPSETKAKFCYAEPHIQAANVAGTALTT